MSNAIKVLAFGGSLRKESWNKMLATRAAVGSREAGAQVTLLDLAAYPLPVYDGDLEASGGLPDNAIKLKDLFLDHDALLISSPEYNSSLSAALKNTIDWVSRPRPAEPPLACFDNKVAGLLAASPGALGGLRGLVHLRSMLSNIKVHVIPDQLAIAKAHEAFAPDGSLKDAQQDEAVRAIGRRVARVAAVLRAS